MGRLGLCAVCVLIGCSETAGSGGSAGTGGTAGFGGAGGPGVACEDSVCPCSEAGILDAIAQGGGSYTFDCDGPTTVVTEATIVIDNDVILDGEDELTICGGPFNRLFRVSAGVSAELRRLQISCGGIANDGDLTLEEVTVTSSRNELDGDAAFGQGDGIHNSGTLLVRRSNVTGNIAEDSEGSRVGMGGGIFNSGTMQLTESTISENAAQGDGGALGGGIYNAEGGVANIAGCTISANFTSRDFTPNESDGGAGVFNAGTMMITNSTISGNDAFDYGGGIHNTGELQAVSSTLADNRAGGGADAIMNTGRLVLSSTIVGGDCLVLEAATVVSEGGNIEVPGDSCGLGHPTDQVDVAAESLKLGPLADNGGPTRTHALMVGSVAIDMIPKLVCVDAIGEPLTTDQRDEPRPETGGSMCDVGSFERQGTD